MRVGFSTSPFLIILFLIVSSRVAMASDDSTATAMSKLLRWKLHIDTRYSLVQGQLLTVRVGSIGYTWGRFQREVAVGYYWLGTLGSRQLSHIGKLNSRTLELATYSRSEVSFVNVGYWHIIHNSKRWKMGVPVEVGLGRAKTQPYTLMDVPLSSLEPVKFTIVPVHIGGYAEWKATRWVGFGLQSGYRLNLKSSAEINDLQGLFYRIRIIVYPAAFRDGFNFVFKRKPLPSFPKSRLFVLRGANI
jgi:hypothetical protein